MKTSTKIAALTLGVLLVPVVAIVAINVSAFAGNVENTTAALPDGTTPVVLDSYVNAFVVPLSTPGAVALVDCGDDVDAKAIKAALAARHQHVSAIFITHGHFDHTTGCSAFAGVPVYALDVEVDAIEGRRDHHSPLSFFRPNTDVGARVSHPLKDDSIVAVDGIDFHIYAVPGHTAGSAVYRARTTAFFGDTASSKTDGRITGPVWFLSDDVDEGLASLHALATRLAAEPGLATFAFGHSGAVPADLALLKH